jgi:hypothetical protein
VIHGGAWEYRPEGLKEVKNEMQLLGAREGVEEGVLYQATWNIRAEGRGC